MRYWDNIIRENLDFEEALNYIKKYPKTSYITRPNWNGVHFIGSKDVYCILLRDGRAIRLREGKPTFEGVYDKDCKDWMIVTIKGEAVEILIETGVI